MASATPPASPSSERPLWLVIAPAEYLAALELLQKFRGKDLATQMVAVEDILTVDTYRPPDEAIHQFVRHVFASSHGRLQYLFLVGDDTGSTEPSNIPIGKFLGDTPATSFESDAVYGDIDYHDPLPEVAVGRFPAHSTDDVRRYVTRLIAYDRAPVASPTRLSFYAGQGGDLSGWGDLILGGFLYATADRMFPRDVQIDLAADPGVSFADGRSMIDLLNGGDSFLTTYLGHGNADSLLTHPELNLASAAQVTIPGRAPILNLLACGAGCFAKADCLGEALVRAPEGPIAVFGSSVARDGDMRGETSPVVLRYFGEALAAYLRSDVADRIGDVFLSAVLQSSGSNRHDFLWQLLGVLSPTVQHVLALRPNLKDASQAQALQLTLLGDPAIRWRPRPLHPDTRAQQRGLLTRDGRTLLPQPRQSVESRIRITQPMAPQPNVADTRSCTVDDAQVLLRLADYSTAWVHTMWSSAIANDFDAWLAADLAQQDPGDYFAALLERTGRRLAEHSFPRFGEIRFVDGRFDIPLHEGGLVLGLNDLSDAIAFALAPWNFRGTLDLAAHVQFAVQLTHTGILRFIDIRGVTLEDRSGMSQEVRMVQIDFGYPEPCITAIVEPEFYRRPPVTCQTWGELMASKMENAWSRMVAVFSPPAAP